ncbi:MAG TPA: hemerythrin domain-containing protein [Burkholderiaceae bacterium]|nr:hemerythrin domain-containing protein [Burkholderiaceae bacterium]
MDIDRFKRQHVDILQRIRQLRILAHAGIPANAPRIAQGVADLGKVVTLHLAIEDRIMYPTVRQSADPELAAMGASYQEEMKGIANRYLRFTEQWSKADKVAAEPEAFRSAANSVLKDVFLRMQRENHEFYPAIERL